VSNYVIFLHLNEPYSVLKAMELSYMAVSVLLSHI